MAWLCKVENSYRIRFQMNGKTKDLRFSKNKYSREDVNDLRVLVEGLVNARKLGKRPDGATCERLTKIAPDIARKLVKADLVDPALIGVSTLTLGELCDLYNRNRLHLKERTRDHDQTIIRKLCRFFPKDTEIAQITPLDAESFCAWLRRPIAEGGCGNSESTFSRELKAYRGIFRKAVKGKFIQENPFDDIKGGKVVDESRKKYIPAARIEAILERLTEPKDAELRFAVALARFAGLRMPSEIKDLTFESFDFETGYLHICEDTKTGARRVPLFTGVRREFERFRATVATEEGFVFPKLRQRRNMGTTFRKRLQKMGDEGWPKIFVNLRASLITDLVGLGVDQMTVSAWVGNSEEVRQIHYLLQREEDERRAIVAILEAEGGASPLGLDENFAQKRPRFCPQNAPEQTKNGANGTTANAWANGDDRATFGKEAASKNASATWNYRSCLDFIEDELEDIACASTSIYDEEDPFFDEDEPTPFERGYIRILAVIRAAKAGEERLREYVRQQAEFLGITEKHARGESNPQPAD